jgi:cysteinyl-tRNA synthetase
VSSQEELRKTGPLESDSDKVLSALFDVEDVQRAAEGWTDADDIRAALRTAVSALDDLRRDINTWFERNDS